MAGGLVTFVVVEWVFRPLINTVNEGRTTRRELEALLLQLALCAAWLAEDLPKQLHPEVRLRVLEDRRRAYDQLCDLTQQIFLNAGRYAGAYPGRLRDLVMRYIMTVHGLVLSRRTRADQAKRIKDLAEPMARAIDIRLLAAGRIVPAVRETQRALDRIDADDEPAIVT